MAEQIRQEYTLDTSQAVQNLNNLVSSYARLENATKNLVASQRELNGVSSKSATAMEKAIANIQNSLKNLDKDAQKVKSLTVSWETMTRVVVTQAIVRALSTVRNEVRRSIDDMSEFQKKVAEIQTIGGRSDTAGIIRGISDQFALDLGDVGAAYYQTLSNQIPVDQSQEFMEAAARFAKAGVTDLEAAVNLLSGTINAYGMDVSQADEITSKFFKTIELGRTTGKEMANDLGRVQTVAAQVGISLDELLADYSAITIAGIKSNMATTQMVGAISAFIKPTEAMKDALQELGYPTGAAALQALGFKGALEAVIATTDGTMEAIGRLSPRIRGLTGTLILTGEGAKKAEENLRLIKKVNDALAEQKAADIMATQAEKVAKSWNQLKNAVTTDIGGHLLSVNEGFFDLIGGADNVSAAIKYLIPVVEGVSIAMLASYARSKLASAGFVQTAVASGRATKALTVLSTVGKAIPGILGAMFVGHSIGSAIGDWYYSESEALKKLRRDRKDYLDEIREQSQERIKIAKETHAELLKQALKGLPDVTQQYNKNTFLSSRGFEDSIEETSNFFEKVVGMRKDSAEDIANFMKSMESETKQSMERMQGYASRLDDREFLHSIRNKSDASQLDAFIRKSKELARAAAKAIAAGRIDKGESLFKRAEDYASRAESKATTNWQREKAYRSYNEILEIGEKAEKRFQKLQKQSTDEKRKQYQLALKDLQTSQKLSSEIVKGLNELSKNKFLPDFKHERLQELAKKFGEINKIPINLDTKKMQDEFRDTLEKASDSFRVSIGVDLELAEEFKKLTGRDEFTPVSFSEGLEDLKKFADTGSVAKEKWLEAQEKIAKTKPIIKQLLSELPDLSPANRNSEGNFGYLWEDADKAHRIFEAISQIDPASENAEKSIRSLRKELSDLVKENQSDLPFGIGNISKIGIAKQLDTAAKALNEFEKLRKAQEVKDPGVNRAEQLLQQLSKPASEVGQKFSEGMKAAAPAIEDVSARLNLIRGQAVNIGQIIASWKAPDLQLGQLATPQPRMALFGGSIGYFSSGGLAKGTDTIPAMLSPGEFVINANATGKFFSQIQALNSGVQPVYRQSGGSVTNIGDISINVNESKTPQQTARQVLSNIRRELRRGSSRLD